MINVEEYLKKNFQNSNWLYSTRIQKREELVIVLTFVSSFGLDEIDGFSVGYTSLIIGGVNHLKEETIYEELEALKIHFRMVKIEKFGELCQLCDRPLNGIMIDGRVYGESGWANMCEKCHKQRGVGLGVGLGQKYQLNEGKWVKIGG